MMMKYQQLQSSQQILPSALSKLKKSQFSGRYELVSEDGEEWIFYFYLGRILYATGGVHPTRRWLRHLQKYCPSLSIKEITRIWVKECPQNNSACWEYQLLYTALKNHAIDRDSFSKIVHDITVEVGMDVQQKFTSQGRCYSEEPWENRVTLLNPEQILDDIQALSLTWKQAGIVQAPVNNSVIIAQPEELKALASPQAYQSMIGLLDGRLTLRELALKTRTDLVSFTRSLLPYVNKGILQWKTIPDFAPPIPILKAPQPKLPQEDDRADKKHTIACIDDSATVCKTMKRIVSKAGYQFVSESQSLRALGTMLKCKPDLIFLDLVMPNTNGYEICSQLRQMSAFKDTPIVILTGNDGVIDRLRSKLAGATSFLSKPVGEDEVLGEISKYLKNTSSNGYYAHSA